MGCAGATTEDSLSSILCTRRFRVCAESVMATNKSAAITTHLRNENTGVRDINSTPGYVCLPHCAGGRGRLIAIAILIQVIRAKDVRQVHHGQKEGHVSRLLDRQE